MGKNGNNGRNTKRDASVGVVIGMLFGPGFGFLIDPELWWMWMAIGIALGPAIGALIGRRADRRAAEAAQPLPPDEDDPAAGSQPAAEGNDDADSAKKE